MHLRRIASLALAVSVVLNLSACVERDSTAPQAPKSYQGKRDTSPWTNARWHDDRAVWEQAIAAREHASGEKAQQAELARLRALFGERTKTIASDAVDTALAGYRKRLAAEIRGGRFDGKERAALLAHLHATAAAELAISNPKALDGR